MKPVNLNQLLFHVKEDSLSFFLNSQTGGIEIETFMEDMSSQLHLLEKLSLAKILEKNKGQIKKILKNNPQKSAGFFLSEELQGYIVLEEKIECYCIIGQTFHVRPLLEEVFVNAEFLLVNVSLYDIKIFRGDFQNLEIVQHYEFDQLPKNFNDHSARIYAPLYMGLVPNKSILAMKTIAQKIKDMILYESIPVLVTGLEDMKVIFLRFMDESTGVITHLNEDFYEKTCIEILDRCKAFRYVVMDYYSAQLKERLKRMMKSRKILTELPDIIHATFNGKIAHLVIPTERKIWGKLDAVTGEFVLHKKAGKTSIDILNELAEEVIKQGGRIQILGQHFFPNNSSVLAIVKGNL